MDGYVTIPGAGSKSRRVAAHSKLLAKTFPNKRDKQSEPLRLEFIREGAWAKESHEIAVKIAYENGSLRGTPKSQAKDYRGC